MSEECSPNPHTSRRNTTESSRVSDEKFPQGCQAVKNHRWTHKDKYKAKLSHGSCPTSSPKQTNLVWLLNKACSFVSHPHLFPSSQVQYHSCESTRKTGRQRTIRAQPVMHQFLSQTYFRHLWPPPPTIFVLTNLVQSSKSRQPSASLRDGDI